MSLLNPFSDRPIEANLLTPIFGETMLELGNKRNGQLVYKHWFESLGLKHTSVDINGEDGALALDLQKPINLGTFDMVTNFGTSEHVEHQPGVWKNMIDALHVDSHLVCLTPMPGDWSGHGLWYPYGQFYVDLCVLNGLEIVTLHASGNKGQRLWAFRGVRRAMAPFRMPLGGLWDERAGRQA